MRPISLEALGYLPAELPKQVYDVPFAEGSPHPAWPIVTNHPRKWMISYRTKEGEIIGNGARRFMADRGAKFHAGIDLYGRPGDLIVAMEDGVIVNHYHFFHGTHALIVQHDSGLVINYGEVAKNSWKEFGLKKGSRVQKGKAIARVGLMSGGSHMLHLETYISGVEKNIRIPTTKVDPRIRNPTKYLLIAKALNKPIEEAQTVAAVIGENGEIEREMTTVVRAAGVPADQADGP